MAEIRKEPKFRAEGILTPSQVRYRAALRPDAVKQLVSIIFNVLLAQAQNQVLPTFVKSC